MSLGIHVAKVSKVLGAKRKTMLAALEDDVEELNLSAVQIYTHGPRNSRKNKMDHAAIKKYCEENKISKILDLYDIDYSYLLNNNTNISKLIKQL